MLSDVYFR